MKFSKRLRGKLISILDTSPELEYFESYEEAVKNGEVTTILN